MSHFPWNDEYAVGHPEIDAQHRQIFSLANELHESLTLKMPDEVLADLLLDLLQVTRNHLIFEEGILEKANYPDLAIHRAIHAALQQQLEVYENRYFSGEKQIVMEILPFVVGEWLLGHISEVDRAYIPWLPKIDSQQD